MVHRLRVWMRRWGITLILLLLFLGAAGLPSLAHQSSAQTIDSIVSTSETPEQQGRQRYEEGRYEEAIALWQHALLTFQTTGNTSQQITVLSNLSLAYQALGRWNDAEAAMEQAISLLHEAMEQQSLQAQVLDVQGRLHLARGRAELALATWQQAAALYEPQGDETRAIQNRLNQAQALQALGLYRQARSSLTTITQELAEQPDSSLKALGLRTLGNVLRVLGDLDTSQQQLQASLQVAEAIANPQAMAEAFFSLGQTTLAQGDWETALTFYQQAALTATSPVTQASARLRQLTLLLENDQLEAAQPLIPDLLAQLEALPPTRPAIFARIELARRLLPLSHPPFLASPIPQILATAVEQAQQLQDLRAESFARGTLAQVYERNGQWEAAATLNQQAMWMAQTANAPEIAYQWHWQLGRLLRDQGDVDGAIAAYDEAVEILQALRRDLVVVDSEVQYSFRDDVEPVYRQFIDLLLAPSEEAISQKLLIKARDTVEALQLAELDNFLREACLAPRKDLDSVIDREDQTAAVIYGIMMGDRLEVILKLPQQPLKRYTTWINQSDAETILADLRSNLGQPEVGRIPQIQTLSEQVYHWLVQPAEPDLAEQGIKTLVFVLDGVLRSVPMAVLYDGQHYLIEKYAIALSSGLQLVDPKPLDFGNLEVLAGGLSEERFFPPNNFFSALKYVEQELDQIQTDLPSQLLLNQQFTAQTLQSQINSHPFPIVHLATHGMFNNNPDETFLVVWDRLIKVNDLDDFLRIRDQSQFEPLELLILSACQTAEGDRRAVLGLAGVAVRAGARSTLASLWNLDDESTTRLMDSFYEALVNQKQPRAAALRQAQLQLLEENPSPYFWAPFVLIGSWL